MDVKRVSAGLAAERKTRWPLALRQKRMEAGPLARESDQDRDGGRSLVLEGEMRSPLKDLEKREREEGVADPWTESRTETLAELANRNGWVDFFDLPLARPASRGWGRRLVTVMANEGLLELERNGTYPNMFSLRLTPRGREEFQQRKNDQTGPVLGGHEGQGQVAEPLGKARQGLLSVRTAQ